MVNEDKVVTDGLRCLLDIYNDFWESEIGSQPKSIQSAWYAGRDLAEVIKQRRSNSAPLYPTATPKEQRTNTTNFV